MTPLLTVVTFRIPIGIRDAVPVQVHPHCFSRSLGASWRFHPDHAPFLESSASGLEYQYYPKTVPRRTACVASCPQVGTGIRRLWGDCLHAVASIRCTA